MLIENIDALLFLKTLDNKSVDLILTDPPYIISKDSGMNKHYNVVAKHNEDKIDVKTEEDWIEYKKKLDKPKEELDNDKGDGWSKENYIKYGTILGKKYATQTKFGEWDENFTMEALEEIMKDYYSKLKHSGTLIIWFDIWKITPLKELMEKVGFKQIRFIEWIKTNPQPINSKINYLTNCREIALLGIKGNKPTFNSSYDNGIYHYPMANGKNRFHPTQKNLKLFEDLIKKHSKPNDVVIDTFLGGGTTAIACKNTDRQFKGCEINKEYFDKVMTIINDDVQIQ
jgi:site-specific DNA-methyltransferase (adenine-specific)|tara:strand:- start:1215 stop:2069 length:855 start_codon:yes stop_codon:yes gene_type:complete